MVQSCTKAVQPTPNDHLPPLKNDARIPVPLLQALRRRRLRLRHPSCRLVPLPLVPVLPGFIITLLGHGCTRTLRRGIRRSLRLWTQRTSSRYFGTGGLWPVNAIERTDSSGHPLPRTRHATTTPTNRDPGSDQHDLAGARTQRYARAGYPFPETPPARTCTTPATPATAALPRCRAALLPCAVLKREGRNRLNSRGRPTQRENRDDCCYFSDHRTRVTTTSSEHEHEQRKRISLENP